MMLLDGSGSGEDQLGGFHPYEQFGGGGGGGAGMLAEQADDALGHQQQPQQQHQHQQPAYEPPPHRAPAAPPTQRGQAAAAPAVPAGTPASAPPIGMYPLTQQQQQQLAASISAWQAQQAALAAQMQEPGYLELLWTRKRDLFKLCVLALVILLAISAHTAVWHYLEDFVDANDLTFGRELALRAAYPAAVLVVLWHFKAFLIGGGKAAAAH